MSKIKRDTIGFSAARIWRWIISNNPLIDSINIFKYTPPPLLQDRVTLGERAEKLLLQTENLARMYGVPFWDGLLLAGVKIGSVPNEIFDGLEFALPESELIRSLSRSELENNVLDGILLDDKSDQWLSIMSKVKLKNGNFAHVPLMDFRCSVSPTNQDIVTNIAKRILPNGGYILNSGASYHLVGNSTLSEAQLIDFLAASLLYSPIVDRLYVAHHVRRRWLAWRRRPHGGRVLWRCNR